MDRQGMNRREFLGLLGKGAVVAGAGGLIVPAAKTIWQVPVQLEKPKGFWHNIPKVKACNTVEEYEALLKYKQELEEEWSGYDGLGRLLKEPVVVHKPASLGCTTYDLMKRMHNSLYPVRTESLVTALKHVSFEPDNIKLWSGHSEA